LLLHQRRQLALRLRIRLQLLLCRRVRPPQVSQLSQLLLAALERRGAGREAGDG
jgi:hypothetical protein